MYESVTEKVAGMLTFDADLHSLVDMETTEMLRLGGDREVHVDGRPVSQGKDVGFVMKNFVARKQQFRQRASLGRIEANWLPLLDTARFLWVGTDRQAIQELRKKFPRADFVLIKGGTDQEPPHVNAQVRELIRKLVTVASNGSKKSSLFVDRSESVGDDRSTSAGVHEPHVSAARGIKESSNVEFELFLSEKFKDGGVVIQGISAGSSTSAFTMNIFDAYESPLERARKEAAALQGFCEQETRNGAVYVANQECLSEYKGVCPALTRSAMEGNIEAARVRTDLNSAEMQLAKNRQALGGFGFLSRAASEHSETTTQSKPSDAASSGSLAGMTDAPADKKVGVLSSLVPVPPWTRRCWLDCPTNTDVSMVALARQFVGSSVYTPVSLACIWEDVAAPVAPGAIRAASSDDVNAASSVYVIAPRP